MLKLFCAALLAVCAQSAAAEDPISLDPISLKIGNTTIQAPVPAGYVRASEKAPMLFASSSAALPPANRLVEMLVAESDLKLILLGQTPTRPYLQVQTIRDAEALDFTAQEWTAFQPILAQQFGGMDLDNQTTHMQAGMGERMSAATGADITLKYGPIGKPTIYAQRPTSMHYTLRLPITAQVNGVVKALEIECTGAVVLAGSKFVLINAYSQKAADTSVPPFAASRAMTEAFVARLQALNPVATGKAKQ